MKKFINKITPQILIDLYLKYIYSKKRKRNRNFDNSPDVKFKEIYKTNYWNSNESASGTGSDLEQTKTIIKEIEKLIDKLGIETILDIPCGDFNWMQKVNLTNVKYVGADIVNELIINNINKYEAKNNIEFIQKNLINDPLPQSDIIINRDCLVHLSFEDIFKCIRNIKSSGCKYLLTSTFPKHKLNYDIKTGDWRPINLEKSPFNLSKPLLIIDENYVGTNDLKDKALGLWLIEDIVLHPRKNWWRQKL
ncbi:MAG TPA: class I SAM-dependent methyltransferase [Hanamia sp.]